MHSALNIFRGNLRFANIFLALLLPVLLFLTFNMHSKLKTNTYHGVIWADAAGYYAYLPMWFIYGNNSMNWPANIENNTGHGFALDNNTNTIKNKYFSGVALLQAPFFLCAHFIQKISNLPTDGFSRTYINSILIASIFYSWLGLLILFNLLKKRFSSFHSLLTILLILLATNLYYYAITANGMSHAYSFFLFSLLLFLIDKRKNNYSYFLITGIVCGLIILCRPSNIIFIPAILLFGIKNLNEFKERIFSFFSTIKSVAILIIGFSLPLLPQLFYLQKSFGHLISYTYTGESFSNWMHPRLFKVWFSTNNGLFTYTPFLLLALAGIVLGIKKNKIENMFIFSAFIIVSLICASWWNWWFGCSYGARNFVEYYALFAFPAADFLFSRRKKLQKIIVWSFAFLCIVININMLYYYDGCFYGSEWDWNSYLKLSHYLIIQQPLQ